MSQAALSRTQQQLLPQVGGGATRERHHCLAHSTRLQLTARTRDTVVNLRPMARGEDGEPHLEGCCIRR